MGGLSIWHLIILLVMIAILAITVGVIWFATRYFHRRSAARTSSALSQTIPAPTPSTTESRLQHLADLRSKGLITDSEYEQQRSAILKGI